MIVRSLGHNLGRRGNFQVEEITFWEFFICFVFYWTTVDLKCCVLCVEQNDSVIHVYIYFLDYFPLQVITKYWVQFPVLYSETLSVICFIYSGVYVNPQILIYHPWPPFPFGNHKLVLRVCGSISVLYVVFFPRKIPHVTDIIWYFVFVWLTSLSVIISRSIHIAANGIISFFFMAE